MVVRLSSATFVGRGRELAQFAVALERARGGDPTVLLVGGEAGVGKSRLLTEVANRARRGGARVLEGGSVQLGSDALPFGPLIEILRGLRDEVSGSGRGAGSDPVGQTLVRLLPELGYHVEPQGNRPASVGSARATVFEQFLGLLDGLAERAPVLVAFEDIHWADRSTLDLIRFLVRNLRRGGIVLVATYRSDDLHRRHPLVPFLAELERGGRTERLALVGFDRLDLGALMDGIREARTEPDLVERIYRRSQGNPFYAEELLAADVPEANLPGTLREVLLARVATLSDSTQEVLRAASAAGPRISAALLAQATGADPESLDRALREAIDRHILEVLDRRLGDRYAFRHSLLQEALYEDLLAGERVRLHGEFARALAASHGPDPGGSAPAELAYHWYAARDMANAFEASIRAGLAAQAIYAYPEATTHFERAIELWDQVPDAAARGGLDHAALLEHAARVAWYFAPARGLAYARSAIALVDEAAEPARAGLLRGVLSAASFTLLNDADALAALREGVRLVPDEPPSMARARVLDDLARTLCLQDQHAESAAMCHRAIQIARQVGARAVEGHALDTLGLNLASLGDVDGGLATIELARSVATAFDTTSRVNETWLFQSQVLLEAGRLEEAAATGIEAAAHASIHGFGAILGSLALSVAFDALFALGRWDEAADVLLRAQEYELHPIADIQVEERMALLEIGRGDFDTALRRLERLRGITGGILAPTRIAPLALGLAEHAHWTGDPVAARDALEHGIDRLAAAANPWVGSIGPLLAARIRAEAAIASAAVGPASTETADAARRAAARSLEQMQAMADEIAGQRPAYLPQASAWLAMSEAEHGVLAGGTDPAIWARTAAAFAALGMKFHEAYALAREGQAALAGRERRTAARALRSARARAEAIGAVPLLAQIDDLLGRAGIGPDLTAEHPIDEKPALTGDERSGTVRRGRHDLTPRELETLQLVAAGLTDGQIAAELFISKKTASVHVANIKDKLGAMSRVDIVRSAQLLGLIDPVSPEPRRP